MSSTGSKKSVRLSRAIQAVLPGLVRTAQQSLAHRAKALGKQEPDDQSSERRRFWQDTGALKPNGEFKKFLHVWSIEGRHAVDMGTMTTHICVPWVPVIDKLDISALTAYFHITNFALMPGGWESLWSHLDIAIEHSRNNRYNHGPYWLLSEEMTNSSLAHMLKELKDRIAREAFDMAKSQAKVDFCQTLLRERLRQFRVLSVKQEMEDATARSNEKCAGAVQVRDRYPLGRPPRCR